MAFENFKALNSFYSEYQKRVAEFGSLAPERQALAVDFPAHFIEAAKRKPFQNRGRRHPEEKVRAA